MCPHCPNTNLRTAFLSQQQNGCRDRDKELLSWYLITVKLLKTVESGIAKTPTSTNRSVELPQQEVHHQQQLPSEPLQIVIQNGCDQEI
ncbi:hypothetical protein DVH24_030097 [Malus domestica]|uniref:Uncharacterized protein n=1 Tax=Malus domestica TaxID=3750 RepID=A0A498HV96_MALDO|nr:hypothetical protein DVH24_030097 [Malus domestica]